MIGKRNAAEDMKRMQEEAINRVKEMHARSKSNASAPQQHAPIQSTREKTASGNLKSDDMIKKSGKIEGMPPKNNTYEKFNPMQKRNFNFNLRKTRFVKNLPSADNADIPSHTQKAASGNLIGGLPSLIDIIFKDSDKSLLIVLIILLMDDEENFMILLVLFYLLI